jgi:hypothetical protein
LPIDVEAIQRSADTFFEQIAKISEEWHDGRVIEEVIPWLITAGAIAYQWVRLRRNQSSLPPHAEENWGPDPLLISD